MKYIISRYNHDYSWIRDYTDDFVMYDRSEIKAPGSIETENIGSDILDKLTYIIDNYESLPEIAVYTKCNLFKYISREEFDKVKNNKTFTPLLTERHKTYMPVCYYKDGIYYEINNRWYLNELKSKHNIDELMSFTGIKDMQYVPFAPGSNYILARSDILKHPVDFYIKLRSYLDWSVYPAEAQVVERSLYTIWS